MVIKTISQLEDFKKAVRDAKGDVYLRSLNGDSFNLKSSFSQYIALGQLLSEQGDNLELFCETRQDEQLFMKFFSNHPETLD